MQSRPRPRVRKVLAFFRQRQGGELPAPRADLSADRGHTTSSFASLNYYYNAQASPTCPK
eukprot:3435465-Pyramimonas_sp.AAC.2